MKKENRGADSKKGRIKEDGLSRDGAEEMLHMQQWKSELCAMQLCQSREEVCFTMQEKAILSEQGKSSTGGGR